MNQNNIFFYVYTFFLYLIVQVLFLRYINFWGYAFSFAYIGYLLSFPLEFPRIPHLLIAFAIGIAIDIFYDSAGIHTGACVFMIYFRKRIVNTFSPTGNYEAGAQPSISNMGSNWFLIYTSIMALFHHIFVFAVSASNIALISNIILKITSSVIFTTLTLFFFQQTGLSYKKYQLKRRR